MQRDGLLAGSGSIDGDIFNEGAVHVSGDGRPSLDVSGDFHQFQDATLSVSLTDAKQASLRVTGDATLAGSLVVVSGSDAKFTPGETRALLAANHIVGKFDNPGGEVIADDGTRFQIGYSETAVFLTAK